MTAIGVAAFLAASHLAFPWSVLHVAQTAVARGMEPAAARAVRADGA